MRKYLIGILAFIFVSSSLFAHGSVAEARAKIPSTNFTGEELFKGLFLAQGEVGKRLTPYVFSNELYKYANTTEALQQSDELLKLVREKDPNYFEKLRVAVYSKNPYRIQKAISDGAEILFSIAQELEIDIKDKKSLIEGSSSAQCLALVWAVGIVVVYYGAVVAQLAAATLYVGGGAVYLYAAAVQYTATAVSSAYENKTSLTNEMFVKYIVEKL